MPDTSWWLRHRLAVALALIGLLSVPAFCHGFLNDMDTYTQTADKLLRGGLLYRDTTDTKPPLMVLHYALIFWLAGGVSLVAVKLITVAMLVASALALRRVHLALGGDARLADLSVLLFVLGSFCGWGQDFLSSNTEIPANLFILLGVWGLLAGDGEFRPWRLALAGASLGIAFLYRYQAGAPLAAYVLLLSIERRPLRQSLPRLSALGAGFLLPAAVLVGYYAAIGQTGALLVHLRLDTYYMRGFEFFWPETTMRLLTGAATVFQLALLAGLQAKAILSKRPISRQNLFLLLYLAVSLVTFVLGRRYYGHYLIASIPPLALLAAARVAEGPDRRRARSRLVAWHRFWERHAVSFLALQVATMWAANLGYYATRPPEPPYADLARVVGANTAREDRIFVWSEKTHLLLRVDRTYATRFLVKDFLVGRMYGTRHRWPEVRSTAESAWAASVKELWPILMSDLAAEKPKVIVDDQPENSAFTLDRYPPLRLLVAQHYGPCIRADGFCVYLRRPE